MTGHAEALAGLDLTPAEVDRLDRYLDLVAKWNARVNLTAARTPEARVFQLVAPVVGARPFLAGGTLLDIGSGNGSPGLVLSLLRPFEGVTLLEPRTRRWAFLREAARELGLGHVEVGKARHDRYGGPPADTVTVRAVALGAGDLGPMLAPAGRVLVWRPAEEAPAGWRIAGRWDGGTALERFT